MEWCLLERQLAITSSDEAGAKRWLDAAVAFGPDVAWWAIPSTTGARTIRTHPDGWVEADVPASHTDAFVSWLLEFGPDARLELPVGQEGVESINQLGAYRVQGKTADAARQLLDDAYALEDAGAFSIVLELVPREIAQMITERVKVPTIGFGAGVHCDIQVLVFHDLLGMAFGKLPRFVREYANLRETITDAVTRWAEDVRNGTYPAEKESYGLPAEAADELKIETKKEVRLK